jgi:hypothetical protein
MPSSFSYYDIDAILAEEELIPSHTNFDFSLLAALDPDGAHHPREKDNYLPQNTRIKIPLWLAKRWATTNFVRLQLPRHYGRRARERYDADPGDADLRCVPKLCRVYWMFMLYLCRSLSHTRASLPPILQKT